MKSFAYIILSFVLLAGYACQEPIVVPGNEAPDDPTVSNILKENYVRKSYLAVLGRIPSDSEAAVSFSLLSQNNCSFSDRGTFLDLLFADEEYSENLYNSENNELLDGISANQIQQLINQVVQQLNNSNYINDTIILALRLENLLKLKDAYADFTSGTILIPEVHSRMVNSLAYDNLVGNGEEWITALFTHFLYREPTEYEIANGTEMLNGHNETLFMQTGSSKNDFVNIFFSSEEYYEGQVRKVFQKHLFREPGSYEGTVLAQQYMSDHDYKSLLKKILQSDEFLGI